MRFTRTSGPLALILAASACMGSQVIAQMRPVATSKITGKAKAAPLARRAKARAPAAKPSNAVPVVERESVNKRDPFEPLISLRTAGSSVLLPPGKAGLVISTVRVDGAVHSPSGMVAVVSNPENSVYFIHEGDRLYDGDVEKIGLDGVTFRENSKDAFGKPVERMVTKRIYASAGELR